MIKEDFVLIYPLFCRSQKELILWNVCQGILLKIPPMQKKQLALAVDIYIKVLVVKSLNSALLVSETPSARVNKPSFWSASNCLLYSNDSSHNSKSTA